MGRKSKDNPADDQVVEVTTADDAVETTGSGEPSADAVVESQTLGGLEIPDGAVELPETIPAIAEQSAVEDRPEPVEIYDVRLKRDAALGEGTRKNGTLVAYVGLPPGVTLNEALTAIRNPHLIKL